MKKIDYAVLRAELDQILDDLQADEPDIDRAMQRYERGMELVKELEAYITETKNTVTKLKAQFDK